MDQPALHPLLYMVQQGFEQYPARDAILDKSGKIWSYADLRKAVCACQASLRQKGIEKGTRVLVAIPMSGELYALLLAIFSLGGIAIFLDPWMRGKQMSAVIRQVRPEILVISPKLAWLAYALPATWRIPTWWKLGQIIPVEKDVHYTAVEETDQALITFTSGTSGLPKGANRTFGFLSAQMEALTPHLKQSHPSRDYTNFPIVGLANLAIGNTIIVPRLNLMRIHQANPDQVARTLVNSQANRLIVSPSLLKIALDGLAYSFEKHVIENCFTGGAPIAHSLIERGLTQFPEIDFEAIFGSTEAEPVSIVSFGEMAKQMNDPLRGVYVGKPAAITHWRLIQPRLGPIETQEWESISCQPGEVGELCVCGDHVNKSYFENPEAFFQYKITDPGGNIWHRMGDMAYEDDGALYLVGRLHRMMHHDSLVIHPFPFEFLLERTLNLTDTAYIQLKNGTFCLYVGNGNTKEVKPIFQLANTHQFPLNRVYLASKSLPRDARHRSKIQIKGLPKLPGTSYSRPTSQTA